MNSIAPALRKHMCKQPSALDELFEAFWPVLIILAWLGFFLALSVKR